jgi:hypothetical protein
MKKPRLSIKEDRKTLSLDRYAEEWVAFANGKIGAHRENLRKSMNKVKKLKDNQRPSVMLIPKGSEGNFII